MTIRFWGTRGSIPTPGMSTARYGGNTPCVEVRLDDGSLVIIDAGTGIRNLGDALMSSGKPVKAHLLISHFHWDHIQGFPFFKPLYVPGNEFVLIGPRLAETSLQDMVNNLMTHTYFPVQLQDLKAKLTFRPIGEETVQIAGGTLTSMLVNHPSHALGFRLESDGNSVVYISDNEPFDRKSANMFNNVDASVVRRFSELTGDPNRLVYEFARGANVLIHDATYRPEEYAKYVGWGHSDYRFALTVAANAGVQTLALFHHDQSHTDEMIDEILVQCREDIRTRGLGFECVAAAEGMELNW
jgi:phosphoribosyl 1,2-cyclic phosphodiesterase